jgi:hypothetical protein
MLKNNTDNYNRIRFYIKEVIIYYFLILLVISVLLFFYSTGFNFTKEHLTKVMMRLLTAGLFSIINALYFTIFLIFHTNSGKYYLFIGNIISLLILQDTGANLITETLHKTVNPLIFRTIETGIGLAALLLICAGTWVQVSSLLRSRMG